jgi:hypothetical protein
MQLRSFLRFLAPLALASLMVACGDDPAGSGDSDDEPKTTKKDSGIIRRKDGGTKTSSNSASEDDEGEDEGEDEEDSTPVKDAGKKDAGAAKADAGAAKCTVDSDCVADDEMDGVGCCDKPTKTCFVSQDDMCPPPKTSTPSQPAYN